MEDKLNKNPEGSRQCARLSDHVIGVSVDFQCVQGKHFQVQSLVALDNPGINALAHHWLHELIIPLVHNNPYFIQMPSQLRMLRVCILGIDNSMTQIAVSVFLE
jgi:hypothetical protein